MYKLLIPIFLLLSGCAVSTYPIPHDLDLTKCAKDDVRCVMKVVDDIPLDKVKTNNMHAFMEGYKPVKVEELYDLGALFIESWGASQTALKLSLGGGLAGTSIMPADSGDIRAALIKYIPWHPNAKVHLAHELEHVKGAYGGWIHGKAYQYTDYQKKVMTDEQVNHW